MPKKHLTKAQLAEIREELLAERARLLRSSADLRELSVLDDSTHRAGMDIGDLGAHYNQKEQAALLASRTGRRLKEVEEAIIRMDSKPDEFGVCDVAGCPIEYHRLMVLPTTTCCAKHAA